MLERSSWRLAAIKGQRRGGRGLQRWTCKPVSKQSYLRHANARVGDRQRVVRLVRDDVDVQLMVRLQQRLVRERLEADLVKRIAGVRDQLPQEDLLVGVEGVDDEAEQLQRQSGPTVRGRCVNNHAHARAVDQSAINDTRTATLVPSKASDDDA